MSSTPIEQKLRTQALAFPGLTALLGSSPFRWYDVQLVQGSAFPAVTVQMVSNTDSYVNTGRQNSGFSRIQFTIWDTDPVRMRQVEDQLTAFMAVFNGAVPQNLPAYANYFVMRKQFLIADPTKPLYQRICDVNIFNSDSI